MGTFICDRCKKQWPDIFFYSCPKCYPLWVWGEAFFTLGCFFVFPITIILALVAWLCGRFS